MITLDGSHVGKFIKTSIQSPGKTIIILDDSPELRNYLSRDLQKRGYATFEMESKAEGYQWIIANRPDLIISDIKSPGMNGFDFLKLLKANPYTSDIPFIFLTAFTDTRAAMEANRLGADDFIFKPFDFDDLTQAIAHVLSERSLSTPDPSV